jgi:two-component system chemotaxis response regulator CheB
VVSLVASHGGVNALGEALAALPHDFPAALVVVLHISPHHRSRLAEILARRTSLHVKQAKEGERLHPGKVSSPPRTTIQS